MSIFLRVLIINGCWILSKAFSASFEVIIWFLSFNLLMWCITLIDLCVLKNSCISGINPIWWWCMRVLILFAKFCWGFLNLCSSVILASSFLFLCCLWFQNQGDGGLVEWIWQISFIYLSKIINFNFLIIWMILIIFYKGIIKHNITSITYSRM